MSYVVVSANPNGTAAITTTVPDDLPTSEAFAAANGGEVISTAVANALIKNGLDVGAAQRVELQAEVAALLAILPPDTDYTAAMSVGDYLYHILTVSEGMASLVTGNTAPTQAQINKRETWRIRLEAIRELDRSRRIDPKVPPFSIITQRAFDDGLISQAKKTFLDTFGQ